MQRAVLFASLFAAIDCALVNYYSHFSRLRSWEEAQMFCRTHYTDLAFVQSQADQTQFLKVAEKHGPGWIGLYRNASSASGWSWSGGWYGNLRSWAAGEPNNPSESRASADQQGRWYDTTAAQTLPCFCVAAYHLPETEKSWEEAEQHCRSNGSDLFRAKGPFGRSVVLSLMRKAAVERVWLGLRFLGGHWLWLDGDAPARQDWDQLAETCPLRNRCGALNQDGLLESRDCGETLSFVCR